MIKIVRKDGTVEYHEGRVDSLTSTHLTIVGDSSTQTETVDYLAWEEVREKKPDAHRLFSWLR